MAAESGVGRGKNRCVQARRPRKDGWTGERRRMFLDHLASCSNVTRATEAVGLAMSSAYELRARDPAFAAAWDEALEAGYATLESMLVDRAAGQQRCYAPGGTRTPDPAEMDSDLALNLLRLRGAIRRTGARPGGRQPRKADADELAEAILAKLDVLSRRIGRER